MAKNRYGWNKRIKEIARKMKQEDKLKRRQSKSKDKSLEEPAGETDLDPDPATVSEDLTST